MQEELRLAEEAKREADLKAEKERKEEEERQAVEAKAAAERARAEEERKAASFRNKADRPLIDLASTPPPPPSKWGNANSSRPSSPMVSRAPPASSGRLPLNARLGGQAAPKTWPQPPSAIQPTSPSKKDEGNGVLNSVFSLWK